MALSNSQYDAIMRECGRQQIENHHKLEERRQEIYARLPVVRRQRRKSQSVLWRAPKSCWKGIKCPGQAEGRPGDLRKQKSPYHQGRGYPDDYLELHYRCPTVGIRD